MKYTVIKYFTDLQDNNYAYKVGDTYPRKGLSPTDERIAELSSSRNKQGRPLIEEIPDEIEAPVEDDPDNNVGETEETTETKPRKRKHKGNE